MTHPLFFYCHTCHVTHRCTASRSMTFQARRVVLFASSRTSNCFIAMKQSLHRDEATNSSRQPIALIGPISPISPIGPICPISPISLIRPISPIRPIGPICLIGPINPIAPPRLSSPPGEAGRGLRAVWAGSYGWAVRAAGFGCLHKQKSPSRFLSKGFSLKKRRLPTLPRVCSTIGAGGLNFSVRNGKRWNPATITT